MSDENIQAFRRGLEAYERREIEAFLEAFDPEVEWHAAFQIMLGRRGDGLGRRAAPSPRLPSAAWSTFGTGKIIRIRSYLDPNQALEAGGLCE